MAGVAAIHAVTSGLAQLLARRFQLRPLEGIGCRFSAVGTSDLKKLDAEDTTCAILLYGVSPNEHLRNRPVVGARPPVLTVNLHLLVSIWADSALREQVLLGWVLRELHQWPVLDRSVLPESAGFDAADQVQLAPQPLSLDDVTKLWQVLTPPYRASATYVARNVPIDLDPPEASAPVVATRFVLGDEVGP